MNLTLKEKLAVIQCELKVHKGQKNNFGNYNYRSAEDILEAIKPMQERYKVVFVVSEEMVDVGGKLAIKSQATIEDLESEDAIFSHAFAIIDFDSKGMQNPQRTGSASSYAKKYALGNLLLIDDTKDSDATNEHNKKSSKPKKPKKIEIGTSEFTRFKKAISEKKTTVEELRTKYGYQVSKAVEEQLNKE